jgi:alcohol dehydrogenase (cytochrome c)
LLWKMNPDTDHDFPGAITCCGINNRGVGLWNDKVYYYFFYDSIFLK